MVNRAAQASFCFLLVLVLLPAGPFAHQAGAEDGGGILEEPLPRLLADLLPNGGEGYRPRTFGEDRWWLPETAFYLDEMNPAGVWMQGETEAEVLLVRPQPPQSMDQDPRQDRLRLRLRSVSAANSFRIRAGEGHLDVPFTAAPRRKPVPVELPLGKPVLHLEATSEHPAADVYRLRLESTQGIVPQERNPKSTEGRNLGTFVAPR